MTARHPVFQAVLDGKYEHGLDLFRRIARPDGTDLRWAGYCLFALGRLLDAKDTLLRARGAGCSAATLELATVLRYLGDADGARRELEALPLTAVSGADRVYALRERAALHLFDGHARDALPLLEEAWRDVVTLGEDGRTLEAHTAQLLGYTYGLMGRAAYAVHYLDVALSELAGVKRLHTLHSRAQALLYDGRYAAARADLSEAASLLGHAPGANAYHAYLQGLLERASGRFEDARRAFSDAAGVARETGETSTEFLGELGLASVLHALGERAAARPHLLRAGPLARNAWQRALLDVREGAWQRDVDPGRAATLLTRARDAFDALGLDREVGWAELHLAETHAVSGHGDEADEALRRALERRHVLGSGAPFLPELRLLPRVAERLAALADEPDVAVLLADRRAAFSDVPLHVRLVTLGGARLLVDEQDVRLGMRRTLELLAFLVARGPASRDAILGSLWPDDDPKRAANYFHQAVHALKETVPTLRVSFDKASRTYHLVCEGPLFSWDAGDVKRALSGDDDDGRARAVEAYGGPFLPDVEADWAREERDELAFSVIGTGLQLMARWSAQGDFEKCRALARRLLDVDPTDAALAEYLVVATLELEGTLAAQRTLLEVGARAERELGCTPDWVDRLYRRLPTFN